MPRNLFRKFVVSMYTLVVLIGCTPMTKLNNPVPLESSTPKPPGFRVVAYATDAVIPILIPYDKLTHINYAFLIPNEDGSFRELTNSRMIAEMVRLAHEHNVKVLISVGG